MSPAEEGKMVKVLRGVYEDADMTPEGISDDEKSDLQFFVEKLGETGFF